MEHITRQDEKRYRRYLEAEQEAVALYTAMLRAEHDPARARIFRELAESEGRHVSFWASKLGMSPHEVESLRPTFRVRVLGWLAKVFGTRRTLPLLLRIEGDDTRMYAGDPEAVQVMREGEEHSRTLGAMKEGTASIEQVTEGGWKKKAAGGAFRAGVLGMNDGLVSNFSLVWGVAGGVAGGVASGGDSRIVLLAGFAGLTAGAFSMAAGEYVSMRADRDLAEHRVEAERRELEEMPEEEREELVLIYKMKGLTQEEAERLADRVMRDKDVALDTMMREELGLDPDQLGSPWGAAISSFLAFAAGAIIPVLPYIFAVNTKAFVTSGLLSGLALLVVGGALAVLSAKNAVWGGLRMLLIGTAAAGVTYLVGSLIGVSLA